MSRLEIQEAVWGDIAPVLQRNGAAEPPSHAGSRTADRENWQAMIDGRLREWEKDPACLEDEGLVAPSREIIQLACHMAEELRDAGVPAPQRVAATGDGGIVFARQAGLSLATLELDAEGAIELALFQDARLVSRQRLR